MDRQAAYGPIKMASKVPPTACAVVPPGTGTLNIIIKKERDEAIPNMGVSSDFSLNSTLTFRTE